MSLSPDLIKHAPDENSQIIPDSITFEYYIELVGQLAAENDKLNADLRKLDFEKVRATLIKPYANKIFYFLCAYCIAF